MYMSGFHLEQNVRGGGGSFWKEELSNARGVWGHAPSEKFELVTAWSLVVSDCVATCTSTFIGKLAARRGSLVVRGGSFTPFPPTGCLTYQWSEG